MKTLILAAVLSLATTSAFATCKSDSADKKLAGAALTSHMKKCETDAKARAASLEAAVDRLTFVFGGHTVRAGASAGVAILGPDAVAGRALEEADSAMYVRKAQRRHET